MTFSRRHVGLGVGMAAAAASVALLESRAQAQTAPSAMFDITDYGAVGDGVTDDAPAFQAAFDAAYATGGVVFVPRGRFRLASMATANLLGGGTTITLRGCGSASELIIAAPQALHFDNIEGVASVEDLVLVGSPIGNDTICAIAFHMCGQARMDRVVVFGVGGHGAAYYADWGSVVHAYNCALKLSNCSFFGCFGEKAVVLVTQLIGLTLEDCRFIDIGTHRGVTYSKVGGHGNGPWVRVRHIAVQQTTATTQSAVRLSRCVFDEGPGHSVIVEGERVYRVGLEDCMFNVLGQCLGARFENVEYLTVDGGLLGWANVSSRAFELVNVGSARFQYVRTQGGESANVLLADAQCRYVRVVDSEFHGGVISEAKRTVIEVDGVEIFPTAPPVDCDDDGDHDDDGDDDDGDDDDGDHDDGDHDDDEQGDVAVDDDCATLSPTSPDVP